MHVPTLAPHTRENHSDWGRSASFCNFKVGRQPLPSQSYNPVIEMKLGLSVFAANGMIDPPTRVLR